MLSTGMSSVLSRVASTLTANRASSVPRYTAPTRTRSSGPGENSYDAPAIGPYSATSCCSTREPTWPLASVATTTSPTMRASTPKPPPTRNP